MASQAEERDRHQHGTAKQIGANHQPAAVEAVGGEAPVEAEDKRRHAVREADGDDAQGATGVEGEPHEGDVVQRVAELARCDCEVEVAKVVPAQQRERPRRPRRQRAQLVGECRDRIAHADLERPGSGGARSCRKPRWRAAEPSLT